MVVSESIIEGCKENNRLAQEELYNAIYCDLIRIVIRYAPNSPDPEDIVNRALLKMFTSISSFNGTHKNFGGWAKRIVINEAIDFLRSKKVFVKRHMRIEQYPELSPTSNWMEEDPSYLLTLLDYLPPKAKAVFNLHAIEGYSHKEIGKMLNMSEANSKWNLHLARKQMKSMILKKALI